MANIFKIDRTANSISLGTANTVINSLGTFYKLSEEAAGLNVLRITGLHDDDIAMTGTLRGAYIDVSNGNTAATGTIRGMELKARTEAPGDTGNNVAVLEGLSISADSKGHSVTTMRSAEFILDGKTGGTIGEAVGLRIANNLQANKATISYGLQIYRDSFDYTADIQLSSGGLIGGSTGNLRVDSSGYVIIPNRLAIGTTNTPGVSLDMRHSSGDYFTLHHDGADANLKINDGSFYFRTDETNANGSIRIVPNGTGWSETIMYSNNNVYSLNWRCQNNGAGLLFMSATTGSPGDLYLQHAATSDIRMFSSTPEGTTKALKIWGWRTGAAARESLEVSVGVDAEDTVSFNNLSNYKFDGIINAVGGFSDNGTAGVDGTFLDQGGNTITVSGGIITNLGV